MDHLLLRTTISRPGDVLVYLIHINKHTYGQMSRQRNILQTNKCTTTSQKKNRVEKIQAINQIKLKAMVIKMLN